jgi:ribosome-binding factor A
MTMRKRRGDALRALCAEVREGDGVSPRRGREDREPDRRKDRHLCKQVMVALNLALQGESGSGVLRDLSVARVEPAPDATRLRVVVHGPGAVARVGASAVLAELKRATGFLRVQVAGAVSRKRVPELFFALGAEESHDET